MFFKQICKLHYSKKPEAKIKVLLSGKNRLYFSSSNEFFRALLQKLMDAGSNFRESEVCEHVFVSSSSLELVHELGSGGVDLVLHVNGNPVQDLP